MLPDDKARCAGHLLAIACSTCDRRNWRPGALHPVIAPKVFTPDGGEYGAQCPNHIPQAVPSARAGARAQGRNNLKEGAVDAG